MSDSPEDEAFRLFQRLEEAAKALDKTAVTLNGTVAGDVVTALNAAKSATTDAAKQLAAVKASAADLGVQITAAKQLVDAAKETAEGIPHQQSWAMGIGIFFGIALSASLLYIVENTWPSSSRESVQNAVLTRLAETPETCTSAHLLLGTSWFWVTTNQGQKIAACGIAIIKQPPPPNDPPAPSRK